MSTVSNVFSGSYSLSSLTARRNADRFEALRDSMEDLQRQMATRQRSDDWIGLGGDRLQTLDLRARLSLIEGYDSAAADASLRLKVMDQTLTALDKSRSAAVSELTMDSYALRSGGTTQGQILLTNRFRDAVDLLNQEVNGRYLFSGRSTDVRPVIPADTILNGAPPLIGLRQAISDRKTADIGGGLGGLSVGIAGNVVSVTKPGAGGLTVTGTSSFDFTTQPTAGDTFTLRLSLPDGSIETRTFTARDANGGVVMEPSFAIGATSADTAANFQAALSASLTELAGTALPAASAVQAARDFFAGNIPGTVDWYVGDSTANPRTTALTRLDDGDPIASGAQADEAALRNVLMHMGVMAAESFPTSDPLSQKRFDALRQRLGAGLSEASGAPRVRHLQEELALAAVEINNAKERNASAKTMLQGQLTDLEGVSLEEAAAKLLSLQTQLQASYQTSSMVSKLSLVNFL